MLFRFKTAERFRGDCGGKSGPNFWNFDYSRNYGRGDGGEMSLANFLAKRVAGKCRTWTWFASCQSWKWTFVLCQDFLTFWLQCTSRVRNFTPWYTLSINFMSCIFSALFTPTHLPLPRRSMNCFSRRQSRAFLRAKTENLCFDQKLMFFKCNLVGICTTENSENN